MTPMGERTCSAIRDIGEHVWGSFIIEPGTLQIIGLACLFCGVPQPSCTLAAAIDAEDADGGSG